MLRGLTMLLMVFVNDFWTVGGVPHFLEHFAMLEDGMGVSDVVFPMFLFAMGMSVPYAIENRFAKGCSGESTLSHILSRTLALLLMGVFTVNSEGGFSSVAGYGVNFYRIMMVMAFFLIWNSYPKEFRAKRWLQAAGLAILAFLALTFRTPEGGFFSAGWWGILGLIGCAKTWQCIFCHHGCRRHAFLACREPSVLAQMYRQDRLCTRSCSHLRPRSGPLSPLVDHIQTSRNLAMVPLRDLSVHKSVSHPAYS